jgi:hypothetical protein
MDRCAAESVMVMMVMAVEPMMMARAVASVSTAARCVARHKEKECNRSERSRNYSSHLLPQSLGERRPPDKWCQRFDTLERPASRVRFGGAQFNRAVRSRSRSATSGRPELATDEIA